MPLLRTTLGALERVSAIHPPVSGVRVSWHERWDSEVSSFYGKLGGELWLPESLLERLIGDQSVHPKRVALLTRRGAPWALVPLRWTAKYWQPLLRGVAEPFPDFLAGDTPEEVYAALNVGIYVRFGLDNPSRFRNLRWVAADLSYELSLDESPELYWREKDRWKSVIQARRRTAEFEVVENDPADTRWVVENWRQRWSTGSVIEAAAKWRDRIAFDEWGLTTGASRSWVLRDGRRPVAGCIGVTRDGSMMLQTVYRDREYDWHSVGTRAFAEAVLGAYELGLREVSFGSGFEYKRWWARPAGSRYTYAVAPLPVHAANWLIDRGSAVRLRR